MNTLSALVNSTRKRVYIYLPDKDAQSQFLADAEREGYVFADGVRISRRGVSSFYALNKNKTVNYINFVGRMAYQCNAENILRVNYKEYKRTGKIQPR